MSSAPCGYDCSRKGIREVIPEYSDIAGIGVVIGYTATAGFTVAILIGYYFLAHQPDLDPFRPEDDDLQPQRDGSSLHPVQHDDSSPNPVDKLILGYAHEFGEKFTRSATEATKAATQPSKRKVYFQKALTKCILAMSDLQILTGLSILTSGYSQLRCGISVHHWQIMVYLAWFSSLTHLSCLTFLRNYLYNHQGERLWRLIGMGALVIMLIGALLPTGNFEESYHPADYAICSYQSLGPDLESGDPYEYISMMISVLLMGLGFLSRVLRLHRTLSVSLMVGCRRYLSERARQYLHGLYDNVEQKECEKRKFPLLRMKRLFCYRPALAIFLAVRTYLDLWSSMILEVWWLLISFAWGAVNLTTSMNGHVNITDTAQWTFGQVAPVVLLAAPLLSVIEAVLDSPNKSPINGIVDLAGMARSLVTTDHAMDEPQTPSRVETMEIAAGLVARPTRNAHDHPDHDFYEEAWFRLLELFVLIGVVAYSCVILFVPIGPQGSSRAITKLLSFSTPSTFINWIPAAFLLGTVNFIVFSLFLNDRRWSNMPTLILLFLSTLVIYIIGPVLDPEVYLFGSVVLVTLYLILSIFCILWETTVS